jgi:hypothetical protein
MIEIMYHTGIIQRDRSGESGKCWNPPVTAPIPMASIAPERMTFHEFFSSLHSSRRDPMMKNIIPAIPVAICLHPEKNP